MEILVVGGIILLLSVMILPSYREGEKLFALLRSAHKLAQDLRRAQEMAMSVKDFNGSIPKGGYGMYFTFSASDRYIMFADCDEDSEYDEFGAASDCASATPANPFPELVEELEFEGTVRIGNLSSSPLVVTFSPPIPLVFINPDAFSATITLSSDAGAHAKTKTIIINKAGLIAIE